MRMILAPEVSIVSPDRVNHLRKGRYGRNHFSDRSESITDYDSRLDIVLVVFGKGSFIHI